MNATHSAQIVLCTLLGIPYTTCEGDWLGMATKDIESWRHLMIQNRKVLNDAFVNYE